MIQTMMNFILCNHYLFPQWSMYMYGKESLENKIPQKGVVSEEVLRHEYDCPAS